MAQYSEVSVLPGAIKQTVYNNSSTAIPHGTAVIYETVSGKTLAVKIPTAGGGIARTAGIACGAIGANDYGTIIIMGPAEAIAGGALATGALLMASDTTGHMGECKAIDTTATAEAIGHVLTAAAAQGDMFEVFVNKTVITKAAAAA